ncbi:MAG: ChaN family lipoprotein [Stenomitos frigidus ULC029]
MPLVTTRHAAQLGMCLLSLSLFCAAPTAAVLSAAAPDTAQATVVSAFNLLRQQPEDPTAVLQKLAQADVVYLGETHDRLADHQAQLAIVQALHQLRPKLAIGMEMFQRPYQAVLNQYLMGGLTEAALQDQSQYQKRWGYSWDFYAPILRFAKAKGLPVVALNTPTEVTRKTSRSGLESLTLVERRFIPPRSTIVLGPDSYRDRLQKIYAESYHGKSVSGSFERFFQAQVLWDETMADRIAYTLQKQPETLVVVLVGQGHVIYGDGIPVRVSRRMQATRSQPLKQITLLLNTDVTERQSDRPIADYLWHSR